MSLETQIAALISAANTLTAAVNGKISEINTRVNQSFTDFTTWKSTVQAKDINGRPQYVQTIDLTGLPTNYFYPVWWQTPGNAQGESSVVISRHYSADAPANPFGDGLSHVAGLNLQIDACGNAWDGGANYLAIKRISQTYRETVRKINFQMMAIARPITGVKPLYKGRTSGQVVECESMSGLYLRGGLTYEVTRSFPTALKFSRLDSEVSMYQYTWPDSEINYTVRPWVETATELGSTYPEKKLAYSTDNDARYTMATGA